VVAPGTIFAIFAGIYYWYPKVTGRFLSEFWGRVHFWTSLIFMNLIFLPMFAQGLAGMHRRMYDGGATYAGVNDPASGVVGIRQGFIDLNVNISHAAWMLALAQVPFILNFFVSLWRGRPVVSDNPWEATTLEWQTPTPPPHGNFPRPVVVYRGPYEYGVAGAAGDYRPQTEPGEGGDR
jgi:cytochrome c oxidase subunit 1